MTLKKKIYIGYGVVFALMGFVIAWAVSNLVSLGKATDAILSENYRSILAAENMVDAIERQDSGILLVFLGDMENGIVQFRENEAIFLEWMARAKDNITIPGESKLIQAIESDYAIYRRAFSLLTDMGGTAERTLQTGDYQKTIYPLFTKVREGCIGLRRLNEETMYAAGAEAGRVARRAIWSTVLVAATALILVLMFSMFLAERIVRPIRHFMEASRRISAGDYAVQVSVETRDELGELAGEFNRMARQLDHYHQMNIDEIISEKNKGEAILSSIEDGLVTFDTRLKVTAINPAARRMLDLGFAERAELCCRDILSDPNVCDLIQKTVAADIPPEVPDERRIITVTRDDNALHYLFSVTAIRGPEHHLSGVVLLLRDVTRLKEVERLKDEFVMAASHELRTPLTSLGMSVDLLLEHAADGLAEKDRELLQAAHEEVYRMKALVNDLLDLSRIEAGRIEMEFENVSISTLFDHVQAVFKSQAEIKAISLTSAVTGDPPRVRADANKITWVLTNLVSNALRYVGKGGHIELMACRIGPHIHLSVRDNGPGIPPEYQSRIFQKFVQIKGREGTGSGLGLAICKEIVRAHGGAIWVESSPGENCTFTFTLPAAQ
ncbi:sensor histidine kinase [Desulfococcus multivorans]|uniref:histidine kinase n=1 Tax=Desulfococcus multivorans DSM 2059 TaxID=1121405 RepID=S7VI50_DESML|nr:ATP-binding protein [Desulfococcus multivorans]AOY57639.1 two component system sensor histidine kinase [Desulfococcus multivorans]AQV00046.1 PAS domain-containing sensor histidine kinase [Desulfococcus multivorans]EPR44183.1 integral membrane sensor signal transduction histidine kinase [Desulfococcus multivorans DSM 2059]SJZ77691.1 two-component system, NtrC family, sensor histidine kinase KinB [Desulfococcus multivorans DSM 2059]